ncbi:hypothetical protein EYF80_012625 [Liparis tanakae]|uniref:Uncharacterized protein n=1 Tax=Liparis tanakae TaxID=230148 RepID=A0A4Z2IGS4_9TELE|nr:hypothetical protein EYF80_012625 [Liparis tanakae]
MDEVFSVNGPHSNTPQQHYFSALASALLSASCCICMGVNMFEPTPRRVIQSLICQRSLWRPSDGESNCVLQSHRRLSGCTPDTEAGDQRIASSQWLPSFCPRRSLVRKMSPRSALVSMALHLKQVVDIHGLPSDEHRDCLAGRKRSAAPPLPCGHLSLLALQYWNDLPTPVRTAQHADPLHRRTGLFFLVKAILKRLCFYT